MQNIVNNLHGVGVQIIAIECSMVPMENHERRLTISRSDPHIRNWRTRNKQKNQKGTKYLYNLEYKCDPDSGDIYKIFESHVIQHIN